MKLSLPMSLVLLYVAAGSQAQMSTTDRKMPVPSPASIAATNVLTNGVIQKVDTTSGLITLTHSEVTNLKMPAMTTAFGVADKKFLEQYKGGDKVRFHVEIVNGAPTVTYIKRRR